ncbi:hypothetical protein C8J57DRAFT_1710490 [Mycena rebaudengoi]|nr:hypothetical protein C8J57DRAFT_1710490 [Mycena rebaudengoi]
MPPLTRTWTLESWWSDSNRPGPTMNLHAAAKPLMRRMYHHQVLAFMKYNAKEQLSPLAAEISLSYLLSKDVSPSTKSILLQHLATRAETKEEASVVQSHMLYHLLELEDWKNVSLSLFALFKSLVRHENIGVETCGAVIALLRERHGEDAHDLAWWALYSVTRGDLPPFAATTTADTILDSGAEPLEPAITTDRWDLVFAYRTSSTLVWRDKSTAVDVVEENVQPYAVELLKARFPPDTHASVWRMVAYLLVHQSNAVALLNRRPCEQLINVLRVSILDGASDLNTRDVFEIFAFIARSLDGAKLVLASTVLDHVPKGLISHDSWTRLWACELLCQLAGHASTFPALVRFAPRNALTRLLSDNDEGIRCIAKETLHRINHPAKIRRDELICLKSTFDSKRCADDVYIQSIFDAKSNFLGCSWYRLSRQVSEPETKHITSPTGLGFVLVTPFTATIVPYGSESSLCT